MFVCRTTECMHFKNIDQMDQERTYKSIKLYTLPIVKQQKLISIKNGFIEIKNDDERQVSD